MRFIPTGTHQNSVNHGSGRLVAGAIPQHPAMPLLLGHPTTPSVDLVLDHLARWMGGPAPDAQVRGFAFFSEFVNSLNGLCKH